DLGAAVLGGDSHLGLRGFGFLVGQVAFTGAACRRRDHDGGGGGGEQRGLGPARKAGTHFGGPPGRRLAGTVAVVAGRVPPRIGGGGWSATVKVRGRWYPTSLTRELGGLVRAECRFHCEIIEVRCGPGPGPHRAREPTWLQRVLGWGGVEAPPGTEG